MKKLSKHQARNKGGHKIGTLHGITYNDIIKTFGKPTFNPEDSGDGKVNFEWVIEYKDRYFSIYDYKTWDQEYTKTKLTEWSVGGQGYAFDFIDAVESKIASNKVDTIQE